MVATQKNGIPIWSPPSELVSKRILQISMPSPGGLRLVHLERHKNVKDEFRTKWTPPMGGLANLETRQNGFGGPFWFPSIVAG